MKKPLPKRKTAPKPELAPKRGRGRPKFVRDPKDVAYARAMTIEGVSQDRIAEVIGIDPKTLRLHFRDILDFSRDRANAGVVANLTRQAQKDDLKALGWVVWYMKVYMGKSDKQQVAHSGTVANLALDPAALKGMTDDELELLERAIGRSLRVADGDMGGAGEEEG